MHLNTSAVAAFFDGRAEHWDLHSAPKETVINTILNSAGVSPGVSVLDVGCGTGVLFPYYLSRNVYHITGVDLSPGMIQRANEKFGNDPNARSNIAKRFARARRIARWVEKEAGESIGSILGEGNHTLDGSH